MAEIEEKKDGRALDRATAKSKKEVVFCREGEPGDEGDPFQNAQEMKLVGLAFSGGGIRSATFNLGIVQSLAQKGLLSKMDYLSTVSGGGYIGSWLTAWIKREGSITKVSDRLDPRQSPEPMAEEVRPIRWLRMFSNYLTPAKSLMSVDSWTVGMTWLRNTLLNQLVIFFMLSALLFGARCLFEVWLEPTVWTSFFGAREVYVGACVLLVLLAGFITVSMQWYDKGQRKILQLNAGKSRLLTNLTLLVVFVGAYAASASLYANNATLSFWQTAAKFWAFGILSFLLLTAVAGFGGYHRCIASFLGKWKNQQLARIWAMCYVTITSALAAFIGVVVLTAVWQLFSRIDDIPFKDYRHNLTFTKHQALAFTLGTPVTLFILGVTVTARMAFLGKYFPDERREWWGRIGAAINRLGFLWLVVAGATLFVRDMVDTMVTDWKAPATIGGWMALVYGTVKAASSAKTSGKEGSK
ncbi:MAG TPA: patatin-like phospholipase family protein, partial [Flavisolibacter sp.]